MENFIEVYGEIALILCIGIGIGFILDKVILYITRKLEGKIEDKYSFSQNLKGLFFWLSIIVLLYINSFIINLEENHKKYYLEGIKIVGIIVFTVYLMRLGHVLIIRNERKISNFIPLSSLFHNLFNSIIIIIGGLLILNTLGISIAPMLTALGVGGLAVALALKDTLSNLFSGIYLLITKNINIGDYVKMGDVEGHITDITLRTTTLKTIQGNLIVIPNSNFSTATLTNFSLPDKETVAIVEVGVSYASDLEFVEKISLEVARETIQAHEGAVKTFEPIVRFRAFGDSSIQFIVVMRATDFTNISPLRSEFIKRLHRRYKEEGIEIPFPIRTLIHKNSMN
ncbi:MAG: mechanosensitive ion channel family protein [Flammeovirgaceae bacterium]|nr:mechanosensitive ion channel family protein [Flammeovirgaceae bacterium]MDW8286909.1 mechanosensitive ion channel family protein [Flammeovirgaceae bacterium]